MFVDRRCHQGIIILVGFCLSFANPVTAEMVISSFSPEFATNTGQVIITLYGSGFQSEQISNILLDQSVTKRYTCSKIVVRSDTELAVTFPLISVEPGPYSIVIKTTTPASYQSQTPFRVNFPSSPHLFGIIPENGQLGNEPFSCVITGSGFMPGCIVEMESRGSEIYPASVNSILWDSIHCSFTGRLDMGDRYLVRVRNSDDQISPEEVYFVVYGPPPSVIGVNPAVGRRSDGAMDITVIGSGFTNGCRIHLHDSVSDVPITNLSPTVVSDSGQKVTGVFDLTDVSADLYLVYVENPDGQESVDEIIFTVSPPAPVVHSVEPSTGVIGDSGFSLSVTGSGFTDGCSIHLRDSVSDVPITNLSPTVVSDSGQKVTGVFDLTDVSAGLYLVYVENPDGQESVEEIIFIMSLPAPVVGSVDPSTGLIGDSSLSLSVTGTGFTNGCRIHLRDSVSDVPITNLSPTVVSDSGQKVTGVFDLTDVSAGLYLVYVDNPDGQESVDEIIFTVSPPAPVVSSVDPSIGFIGDSGFSLSVTGSGFTDGCRIHLRDPMSDVPITNMSPTIVSESGQKVTGVLDFTGATVGSYRVSVVNPDGQESDDEIIFTLSPSAPVVSSVEPSTGFIGDSGFFLSVTGFGFIEGCCIHLRDSVSDMSITNLSSTAVSDSGQKVTGVFDLTGVMAGSYGVYVENPDGQESDDEIIFTLSPSAPVVSSVEPSTGFIGDSGFSLSVTGTGFTDGCCIQLVDSMHPIKYSNISPTITSKGGTSVQGLIDLSHVPVGSYSVMIENPDTQISNDNVIFQVREYIEPHYDIHITAGQGGLTFPSGIIHVPEHSDLSIDIMPDSGYQIQDVYLDTKPQGSMNSLFLTDISTNHSVFVDFSKNHPIPSPFPTFTPTIPPTPVPTIDPVLYLLNISAEYGGIIQPNGSINVLKGSDVAFQIESLNDFNSSSLQIDDEIVYVNKSWILQSVQSNHTIRLISNRTISPYWADFNMTPIMVNDTHLVLFTSGYYPDCLWELWDYGDGSITYGGPMNHSYSQSGLYSVSHKVVFRNSTSQCNRDLLIL